MNERMGRMKREPLTDADSKDALRNILATVDGPEWSLFEYGAIESNMTMPCDVALRSFFVFKAPNSAGGERTVVFGVWFVKDGEDATRRLSQHTNGTCHQQQSLVNT